MSAATLTADRTEIADLFTRLAHLLDERRWGDAGTVYTDDVTVTSPRDDELHGLGQIIAFLRKSEVEGVQTQHVTTDLLVTVDGDRADTRANSLVYFFHEGRPPHQRSGLRLTATAVRTPAGWRLRESRIRLAWTDRD